LVVTNAKSLNATDALYVTACTRHLLQIHGDTVSEYSYGPNIAVAANVGAEVPRLAGDGHASYEYLAKLYVTKYHLGVATPSDVNVFGIAETMQEGRAPSAALIERSEHVKHSKYALHEHWQRQLRIKADEYFCLRFCVP
jgi:hypothetical protein